MMKITATSTAGSGSSFPMAILQILSVIALALVATRALGDVGTSESRLRTSLIQGRAIDREWRVEVGANYGSAALGDNYLNTQNLGATLDLHVSPKFSLGVRYAKAYNQLTKEGENRFAQTGAGQAVGGGDLGRPRISYPEEQVLGVLDWYMTYGKINLFDWRTVHFDIYSLAGFGQIKVGSDFSTHESSEWTNTWTAGAGIGFWLSRYMTTRFELRYQSYSDKQYEGSRDLDLVVGTLGLGVLL